MTQSRAAVFLFLLSPYQMKAPAALILAEYTDHCWIFSRMGDSVVQQQREKLT